MARIRTIKPEFFTSEDIVSLSPMARLLYISTWCEADREGRLHWKPRTFKMRYFPADDCDIDALAREVVASGLVKLYGDGLAIIPTFKRHQHINPRESESVIPPPGLAGIARVDDASARVDAPSVTHREEGKEGKEGMTRRFAPPTPTEVNEYASSKGLSVDGEKFCDFYISKGWKIGKETMKDWQAAVRTWGRNAGGAPSEANARYWK